MNDFSPEKIVSGHELVNRTTLIMILPCNKCYDYIVVHRISTRVEFSLFLSISLLSQHIRIGVYNVYNVFILPSLSLSLSLWALCFGSGTVCTVCCTRLYLNEEEK